MRWNEEAIIVIPTYGRAGQVKTLDHIPPSVMPNVRLCVRDSEARDYFVHYPDIGQLVIPDKCVGPALTRQAIFKSMKYRYIIQLDDDFKFFRRIPGKTNLLKATPEDVEEMFERLIENVMNYGHAGVSARGGNNHVAESEKEVCRMAGVYAHDTELLRQHDIRWDRVPVMEDFDVTLNLLRRGYRNCVLYEFAFDQAMTNQPGGCSDYRTPDLQRKGAQLLEVLHYPYVTAIKKKANNWKGFGGFRWDVNVQWQRAFKAADLS